MKEKIYTIPLMDAFKANDECPFCFIQRQTEQHAISFLLGPGASYMEEDIRMATDKTGFCRHHLQMMYNYGNRLGTSLILSTHLKQLTQELTKQMDAFKPGKSSFLQRQKKTSLSGQERRTVLGQWLSQKEADCYVCNHYQSNYERYLDTFFELYKGNKEFQNLVKSGKGFCLPHFDDLVETAEIKLNDKQKAEFYPLLFQLQKDNLNRLQEEVTWFTDMFDYRNQGKDWKSSKDSLQRGMQKIGSGYPADPVFQADK